MELNKSYANGDNGDGTKIFQEMCLTMSTNLYQYSGIWNDLKNSTLLGTDNYPKTTTVAYNLLCHYKKPASPYQLHAPPEEVTFIQSGDTYNNNTTPVNDGRSFPEVTCYCCQDVGNYAVNCLSSTANTSTVSKSLQVGLTITQTTKEASTTNIINPNWILLDTSSTISPIRNNNLVHNIQPFDSGEKSGRTQMVDTNTITTPKL